MSNKYEYLDPDHTYIDKDTGVLRNLAGFTNENDLHFFESAAVTKRAKELADNPLSITNSRTLLDIHRYLFQDVYEWAGEKEQLKSAKKENNFFLQVILIQLFSILI